MDRQIDWQNSFIEIKARGQHILENEKWTDCRFLVGTEPNQEIISGHKLILAMSSPVFEGMFYGNLPDKTDPIKIPDSQPDAFRAMLTYIYSDKINVASFDKACELYYVAKKYLLPHVVEQCTNFLLSDLCPRNACRAYEFAKLFDEPKLMHRCIEIICTKTREVLCDPSFIDIELPTLLLIFDQERLNIQSELDLFSALNQYATERGYLDIRECDDDVVIEPSHDIVIEHQVDVESMQDGNEINENDNSNNNPCDANMQQNLALVGYNSDDENRSLNEKFIKEAVRKIRFLTLTPQQFAEGPACSRLLSQNESLKILINISSPGFENCQMPLGFCTSRIPRNFNVPLELVYTRNEQYLHYAANRVECNRNPVSVQYRRYDEPALTNDIRRFYCVRTVRQQKDYRNSSVTDCALTFRVDNHILITGVQVPTQVLCEEMIESVPERYSEILYAHLLDAQGARLTYTHCTSRVRYDSLLEISFDRPVFIHRNKSYKIGVVFNKVGWYPMYTCYRSLHCENVNFSFNVGAPHESVRDGLIRAIAFVHPHPSSSTNSASPENYAMFSSDE